MYNESKIIYINGGRNLITNSNENVNSDLIIGSYSVRFN